ncbi:MAG TPA: 2-phospho-L-lactate transferase [Solirubrobacteraceae bacterium]
MSDGPVVILAGGTGGAKLARGMLDVVGGENLVVIVNTGDDIEIYGSYVSPDPDLVTFWLADRIDSRGWGLEGDTFQVMDGLRELGIEVWFNLGDRDLAICLERARRLKSGERLTEAQQALASALGVAARVLPMADQPVRTRVQADQQWWSLQEFLIRRRGQGEVQDVDFRGRGAARPTPEVLAAIADARAIIIGPSNPVISIGPILAVPGLSEAIVASTAPTVAVSPIVGGAIVKGPTESFMRWRGQSLDGAGIANVYTPLLDGIVADEPSAPLPMLETSTLMNDPESRRRLAEQTLRFALTLSQ